MQLIWSAYRNLIKKQLYRRCSRCILSERYTTIDAATGLCQLCGDGAAPPAADAKGVAEVGADGGRQECLQAALAARIDGVMHANPAAQFHALLLFSGGKDSCYMLMRLQQDFPGLRVLCLSIDNTFMSPVAIENINSAVKSLGVAHLWIRPPAEMMSQVFRSALSRVDAEMGIVDMLDGEFLSDLALTTAKQQRIPLILMGMSAEQVETIVGTRSFELPLTGERRLPRTHVRGIRLEELADPIWSSWWWRGLDSAQQTMPAFLFPLYAWRVSESEIKNAVAKSGVVPMKKLSPLLTNHQLIMPMAVVDYVRHGYFTYEPELASMIRSGRARRRDWIWIFELMEYASKTGKLLGASFDTTLARLNLRRADLNIPL